ncbi:MAG: hypothetical protein IPN27_12465 [Cellvibrionales bacterium]|nr:hypothetical protein [Cellvibrionales bacterium]
MPQKATFFKDGGMVARKGGTKANPRQEMLALGCEMVGRFAKHKFRHVAT